MGDALESRSWYRLHWLTWVVLFLVGGSLVVENLVKRSMMYIYERQGDGFDLLSSRDLIKFEQVVAEYNMTRENYGIMFGGYFTGWPLDYLDFHPENLSYIALKLPLLASNILIALVILFATVFTTESYLRRQPRWQFSIQSIIAFTVFVGLLLANAKYRTTSLIGILDEIEINLIRWRGDSIWEFIPFFFIAMGLWCVFWTGWRLVGWGVGRIGGGLEDE